MADITVTGSPQLSSPTWGLSAEQKASAAAALSKAGMSADRLAKAGLAPTPAAKSAAEPSDTAGGFIRSRGFTSSPSDTQRMAAALIAAGVPAERVEAAAKSDGLPNITPASQQAAQEELLFGATPANEIEAHFPQHTAALASDPEITAALPAGDPLAGLQAAFKDGASRMGLSKVVAASVLEDAIADAQLYQRMDAGQRAEYDKQQKAQLAAVFPDVDAAQKGVVAIIEKWNAANPTLVQALLKHGLFRSSRVQGQLALAAKRATSKSE